MPSPPPLASVCPSGENSNVSMDTGFSEGVMNSERNRPSSTFHNRMIPPWSPMATVDPAGENTSASIQAASRLTVGSCPRVRGSASSTWTSVAWRSEVFHRFVSFFVGRDGNPPSAGRRDFKPCLRVDVDSYGHPTLAEFATLIQPAASVAALNTASIAPKSAGRSCKRKDIGDSVNVSPISRPNCHRSPSVTMP